MCKACLEWNKNLKLLKENMWNTGNTVCMGGSAVMGGAAASVAVPSAAVKEVLSEVEKTYIITPKENDSLFWCMYIIETSPTQYEFMTANREISAIRKLEMDLKIKIVEKITSEPAKIKTSNQKVTKIAAEEIKSNLATGGGKTGFGELVLFCIYMEHRVRVIMDGVLYMDIIPEIYTTVNTIVYSSSEKKFSIDTASSATPRICVEQYTKPICGFSAYKTEQLHEMYSALFDGADVPLADTKKVLYEKIRSRIFEIFP